MKFLKNNIINNKKKSREVKIILSSIEYLESTVSLLPKNDVPALKTRWDLTFWLQSTLFGMGACKENHPTSAEAGAEHI